MRDLAQVESFTEAEQDRFEYLVRHFLAGKCFVRRRDAATDEHWRFILRYHGVLAAYFAVAGWEFEVQQGLGAAVARPTQRRHSQLFSLAQTHLVYNLLHAHYEATTGGDLDQVDEVKLSYGDILERVERSVPLGTKISRDSIKQACKKLSNFGAISLPRGFAGEANEVVTIHPVIELVIPRSVVERNIQAIGPGGSMRPEEADLDLAALDQVQTTAELNLLEEADRGGAEPEDDGESQDEGEWEEDSLTEDEEELDDTEGSRRVRRPAFEIGSLLPELEPPDDDIISEVMRDY